MKNFFITIGAVAFVGLCSALSGLWSGMLYFALVGIIATLIYWIVVLIINYKHEYYTLFNERFNLYVAKLINYSSITRDDIEKNTQVYVKKFKRTLLDEKIRQIMIMAVMAVIIIICVSLIFSGKLS